MKMLIATVVAAITVMASVAYAGQNSPYYGTSTNGDGPEWKQKAFSGSEK
jgi:hypothetical protein